eukprot:6529420-Prymnesium_polylepis.1
MGVVAMKVAMAMTVAAAGASGSLPAHAADSTAGVETGDSRRRLASGPWRSCAVRSSTRGLLGTGPRPAVGTHSPRREGVGPGSFLSIDPVPPARYHGPGARTCLSSDATSGACFRCALRAPCRRRLRPLRQGVEGVEGDCVWGPMKIRFETSRVTHLMRVKK